MINICFWVWGLWLLVLKMSDRIVFGKSYLPEKIQRFKQNKEVQGSGGYAIGSKNENTWRLILVFPTRWVVVSSKGFWGSAPWGSGGRPARAAQTSTLPETRTRLSFQRQTQISDKQQWEKAQRRAFFIVSNQLICKEVIEINLHVQRRLVELQGSN